MTSKGEGDPEAKVSEELEKQRPTDTIVMIGDRPVAVRSVPQCLVCQSDSREIIERGYMLSRSYRRIALDIPEDSDLWYDSRNEDNRATLTVVVRRISRHFERGHGNKDQAVRYAIMEAHARKSGVDVDGIAETIVTEVGVLNEVVRRGYEQLVEEDRPVSTNQMLRAAETLMALSDIDDGAGAASQFEMATRALLQIIADRFGIEAAQMIISDMQGSPEINAAVLALQSGAE